MIFHKYTVAAANGEGEKAEITVNVKPAEIVRLSVTKTPVKTQYKYGEEIDTTGLELLAEYSDGTTRVIKTGYTLNAYTADRTGTRTVRVNFGGAEAGYKIKVKMTFVQIILKIFTFGLLWK